MEKVNAMTAKESKKICVLIDDDKDDQFIFSTVIKTEFPHYNLYLYDSFDQAKNEIFELSDKITNLFIDLNMPKYDGIDCLKELRHYEDFKKKAIIIYTTSNNPEDKRKCLENGATEFITKPSSFQQLVEKIGQFLAQ